MQAFSNYIFLITDSYIMYMGHYFFKSNTCLNKTSSIGLKLYMQTLFDYYIIKIINYVARDSQKNVFCW